MFLVEQECLGEEEDEDGTHAVVAETFGGAGGEDEVKTFGMSGCAHKKMRYVNDLSSASPTP